MEVVRSRSRCGGPCYAGQSGSAEARSEQRIEALGVCGMGWYYRDRDVVVIRIAKRWSMVFECEEAEGGGVLACVGWSSC